MYKAVALGALRVSRPLLEAIPLAARHGFEGLVIGLKEVEDLGAAQVRTALDTHGVKPAVCGFPVDFRGEEEAYRRSLEALPARARTARSLGCRRTATYILPYSDSLPFDANFTLHRRRLRGAAVILADEGIRLGLEFVAPERSRRGRPHPFIHDLDGMLELVEAIDLDNVGLLLDSWHWYIAGHDVDAILALSDEARVVHVHVNDAPAGIPRSEQEDLVRCLPGETGVIDIAGFLQALERLGYTGPVSPEPFSKRLKGVAAAEALAVTARSMDRIWRQAGL